MPKKFVGENSKAAAAKERKAATKEQQTAKKKQQAEDEFWKDDNKHIARKQQRKVAQFFRLLYSNCVFFQEDQDRKKEEAANRKAEAKALLEKEMVTVGKPAKAAPAPRKITRAEITQNAKPNQAPVKKDKVETHLDTPLEENLNRITLDGEEARNISDAIILLKYLIVLTSISR